MKPIVRLIILFVFALAILSITQKKNNQTLRFNSSAHHGDDTLMQRGEKRRQKATRLKHDIDHSLDQLIKSGT